MTAAEVEAEYALGRTGKAINVTDTAVCLGGSAPRAQLDVRGSALFQEIDVTGNIGINSTGLIETFSGTTAESTFDNGDQVLLNTIGPGAGMILMYANYNGYDRTGARCYTYAASKNVAGGNMSVDIDLQSVHVSSTTNFNPYIVITPTGGSTAKVYIRSTGDRSGQNVVWKVVMYRLN